MEEEYSDNEFVAPIEKFSTIGNLENAKRFFFNGNFEEFQKEIKSKPYKFYCVNYKYNSDFDGRMDFIARNFNRGFVQEFENIRKYFMIVFRCNEVEPKVYQFTSQWIVNTNDTIETVIKSRYDDFDFQEITGEHDITTFMDNFKKTENYLSEEYVH